jgi:nitrate reductase cytochrome c-type subunit
MKKTMKKIVLSLTVTGLMAALTSTAIAEVEVATLRESADLADLNQAPVMQKVENHDQKRSRAYPVQPPTIPHKIDNYQIDLNFNKCLSCHNRENTEESQAPMVSVTHYMDRDKQILADVSPNRYFCTQCHVIQLDAKLLVETDFISMDKLIKATIKQPEH